MVRRFGFALALVFGCLVCAAQDAAPMAATAATETAPTFASAEGLAHQGKLDVALTELNTLAAHNPVPAGVERLRGIIFYQKNEFTQAIDAFSKAEAQDPQDRESTEMHGVTLFRMGHVPEAIPYLERARTPVETANIDPNYVLALCYADVQRYDDSRHAFAAQFGFAPDSARAYLLAGRMFLRRELRDEAAAQAEKALALDPKLPLAHELLGEVALARGDVAGAIRELEAERAINPMEPSIYDRLGDAYLRNGEYTKAQTALDRAVLLEPNSTGPFILLGETFLKLNHPITALHYLVHAVHMDPSNYVTHNLLGQAYRAVGDRLAAGQEFKTAVELQHQGDPKPTGK